MGRFGPTRPFDRKRKAERQHSDAAHTRGPGRDAPRPMSPLRREVEAMANHIAHDVAKLEQRTIDSLLPALVDARDELRRGLAEWLSRVDGAREFTAQDMRRGLVAVEAAIDEIVKMRPELQAALTGASADAATIAAGHIRDELARFARFFGETVRPTQISTAAIIADTRHEIIPRIRTSSARYVQAVRDDMRHQIKIGLVKGETFQQMSNRLRRLGGPRGMVALRGIAGEPGAHVEEITEGLFARYAGWAERVVRTEVINAYNVEHVSGIEQLNDQTENPEDKLLLKWDASPDARSCSLCLALDGQTVAPGLPFSMGVFQPPLHPCCRCVVVAWHPSWGVEPAR